MALIVATSDAATVPRPRWPESPFDPGQAYLHYGGVADELVLYFDPEPVANYSSLIDAPEEDDVAVLIGMGPNDEDTGEVVGIHLYPVLAGAAKHRPHWRALTEPHPAPEALARFVAEVKELFERYWTPPPPFEEQLARPVRHHEADGGEPR